VDVFGNKDKD
jgi:hypothetical protein